MTDTAGHKGCAVTSWPHWSREPGGRDTVMMRSRPTPNWRALTAIESGRKLTLLRKRGLRRRCPAPGRRVRGAPGGERGRPCRLWRSPPTPRSLRHAPTTCGYERGFRPPGRRRLGRPGDLLVLHSVPRVNRRTWSWRPPGSRRRWGSPRSGFWLGGAAVSPLHGRRGGPLHRRSGCRGRRKFTSRSAILSAGTWKSLSSPEQTVATGRTEEPARRKQTEAVDGPVNLQPSSAWKASVRW